MLTTDVLALKHFCHRDWLRWPPTTVAATAALASAAVFADFGARLGQAFAAHLSRLLVGSGVLDFGKMLPATLMNERSR